MNKHQLASKRGKKLTVFLSGGYTVWKMQCILSPKGITLLLGKKKNPPPNKQTKHNKKENGAEITILPLSLSFNFLSSAILIISDFAVMECIYF